MPTDTGRTNTGLTNTGLTNTGLTNTGLTNSGTSHAGLSNSGASSASATPSHIASVAQQTLIANLRNAHALETQVLAVLEPQLSMLTEYPDLHAQVTRHIAETHEQMRRLETALEACGSSTSMIRDTLLSIMGLGQSSVQGISSDGLLKAVVADTMTEQLEIATYRTLIVLAEMAGMPQLRPALEKSLKEEQAMAEWFHHNLEAITRRFVELEASENRQAATQ